jgi:SAM-dependent methyltransferase
MSLDLQHTTLREAREFFRGWAPAGSPPEEMAGYIHSSAGRMLASARALSAVVQGGRVLEVGAHPYFFSLLMKKARPDLEWITTNWRTAEGDPTSAQKAIIENHVSGEALEITWYRANVEESPLPFEPESFQAVAYCEVLEHLFLDPVGSLEHIHAVLEPGGLLLLTTPNPSRAYNVQRVLTQTSIYDPISGYGPYGRHNREYSRSELVELLENVGYDLVRATTVETSTDRLFRRALARIGYGEHHVVTARRRPGKAHRYRPAWLYRSFDAEYYAE